MDVVSALVGAVAGGLVVHLFTLWRDRRNAQRTRRIEHLVSAYQRLIDASQRVGKMTRERAKNVEDAISDVLLLGQQPEVDAAAQFIEDWAATGSTNLRPLLIALRDSLREELRLDKTSMPEKFNLRITPK